MYGSKILFFLYRKPNIFPSIEVCHDAILHVRWLTFCLNDAAVFYFKNSSCNLGITLFHVMTFSIALPQQPSILLHSLVAVSDYEAEIAFFGCVSQLRYKIELQSTDHIMGAFPTTCSPSVDWMSSPPRRPAATLTFDVWPPEWNRIISSAHWIFSVSFIEIAHVVHEIIIIRLFIVRRL